MDTHIRNKEEGKSNIAVENTDAYKKAMESLNSVRTIVANGNGRSN